LNSQKKGKEKTNFPLCKTNSFFLSFVTPFIQAQTQFI